MKIFSWRTKAILKIIVALIPYAKDFFTFLGLYRAGSGSDSGSCAPVNSFIHHVDNAKFSKIDPLNVLDFGSGPTNYASLAAVQYNVRYLKQIDVAYPKFSVSTLLNRSSSAVPSCASAAPALC